MPKQQTKTIDERFDEVTQAFLDHRDYTTFVYDKLSARFDGVDGRLDRVEARLDRVDGRLDKLDGRLGKVEGRLDKVDGRLGRIELVLSEVLNEVKALSVRNR